MQLACILQPLSIFSILNFLLVAAILGHLYFLLSEELRCQKERKYLERAAQIYQQATCDTSVKQAVETLFKDSHIDTTLLVEKSVQIALNNLLCMNFTSFLLVDKW